MRAVAIVSLAVIVAATAWAAATRDAAARDDRSCSVDPVQVPLRPAKIDGVVVGSTSSERARASTAWMEQQVGIKISPDYADLPRVVVRVARGQTVAETLAAVVDGRVPRPGDHVEILSRHRDPRSRCNFIPWTVNAAAAVS